MLEALDEVDWSGLAHASGSAKDVPNLLRALGSSDGLLAMMAFDRIVSGLFSQGEVFEATVPAVGFLVEVALTGRHQRAKIVDLVGSAADPDWAYGAWFDQVRSAVVAHAGQLVRLLSDPDARVRAAAAYTVAQCGDAVPIEVLWERWWVEDAPDARASLLLALHLRDPAGCGDLLPSAVIRGPHPVRAAAALALFRARAELPVGARAALAEAIAAGAEVRQVWRRDALTLEEQVACLDDPLRRGQGVPAWVVVLAGQDAEDAEDCLDGIAADLLEGGEVDGQTVSAMSFLVELAMTGPHPHLRARIVETIGSAADPDRVRIGPVAQLRSAVVAQAGRLVQLLSDPEAEVRALAAYAVAQCGDAVPVEVLWERWAVEGSPDARASLLLALHLRDPAGCGDLLPSAMVRGPHPVRVAAALAMLRAGMELPVGAQDALAEAIAAGAEVRYVWRRKVDDDYRDRKGHPTLTELLAYLDDAVAAELLARLLVIAKPKLRRAAISAIGDRCQVRRSAPPQLVRLLGSSLADDAVRGRAVAALRRVGSAAGVHADALARVADGYPGVADQTRPHEKLALETLALLGDPRWVDPVCAAWAAGHEDRLWVLSELRPDPAVLLAVRQRLAELAEAGTDQPNHAGAIVGLVEILGWWGSAASAAEPELLAALPRAPDEVTEALAAIETTAPAALPHLRAAALAGRVAPGVRLWQLTGDTAPLVSAVEQHLTVAESALEREREQRGIEGKPVVPAWKAMKSAVVAGEALGPLVPRLRSYLTQPPPGLDRPPEVQIAAAHIVWLATSDATDVLPTVAAVLAAGRPQSSLTTRVNALLAVRPATELAALLVEPSLAPLLREWLHEEIHTSARVAAARALWRLGDPVAELVPLLTTHIESRHSFAAVSLLVEMGGVAAVPELARLAEREERVGMEFDEGGYGEDFAWTDQRLQRHLRAAVAALSTRE